MSEPFLAEIRIVGFNFAPRGFAQCDGQVLPINQNQSLYSLLGTTYGGDGRTSFALPDLRGRAPVHPGTPVGSSGNVSQGQRGGSETVSLTTGELPNHTHVAETTAEPASTSVPDGAQLAKQARFGPSTFAEPKNLVALNADSLGAAGANESHDNMQPYLPLNFVIALRGVFPSRN